MHGRFIFLKRSCNLTSIEHQRLRRWLCDMPLLKLAYELKEEFYDIFDKSANRDEAGGRYDQWVSRITPDLEKYFNSLVALITKWRRRSSTTSMRSTIIRC